MLKKGVPRFDLRDPYHLAVALTWPQFLALLLAIYLAVNVVFAGLYFIVPGCIANARPHNFPDAFFFSVETVATVGYGDMYPITPYGRTIVTMETVAGITFTAILTGLTFVRFSRPRAWLLFAANPVVASHEGKPALMVQVGNGRASILLDAAARMSVIRLIAGPDSKLVNRVEDLRLERSHIPIFPFTWTLMHALDERSPLHGLDADIVAAEQLRIIVVLQARDPTVGAQVDGMRDFAPEAIRFGMRYADIVTIDENGLTVVDMKKIGVLEPDSGDRLEAGWTTREEL
jgi:inward rectifier potassium channel